MYISSDKEDIELHLQRPPLRMSEKMMGIFGNS
jgi:hypothetical protein